LVLENGKKWHICKDLNLLRNERHIEIRLSKENSLRAILVKCIYAVTRVIHSDWSIKQIEKLQFFSFSKHQVTKSYIKLATDRHSCFFTHQRPPTLAPFLCCYQNKIPTTSFFLVGTIWLQGKFRNLDSFFGLMLMKKKELFVHLTCYYNKVKVVVTPQFEPYTMEQYSCSKDEFYTFFR
jgi:hypothetical protein